jgi:hypothetical protein
MGRAYRLRAFSLANEFENANNNSRSFSNDLELLQEQIDAIADNQAGYLMRRMRYLPFSQSGGPRPQETAAKAAPGKL